MIRLIGQLPACLLTVLLFFQFFITNSGNAADNGLTAMRLGSVSIDGQPGVRLVIETSNPLIVKMMLLSAPYRLVIDMRDVVWQIESLPKKDLLNRSPVVAYRFGQPQSATGRLVIEMDSPAAPLRAFALPPTNDGYRLAIDIADNGKTAFQVAAAALRDSKPIQFGGAERANEQGAVGAETKIATLAITLPIPKPEQAIPTARLAPAIVGPTPKNRPNRWVVFIDAGHGGKDPGAVGWAGTKEKDITLAAAVELARQLQATGKIRAVLSRSDDRYLKLRQRIKLARSENADLFVSLHADSAASKSARGMSVFTLSETASDKEAEALARNENRADLIGGPDLGIEDPEAANELLRMFQRESMNQSTHFAGKILQEIKDMPGGDKRGHRFAGFAVLKAPDMPSVLVEMGFLSNRQDEANLNRKSYRRKLAGRLTGAIVSYLEEFGPEI